MKLIWINSISKESINKFQVSKVYLEEAPKPNYIVNQTENIKD